MQRVVHRVMSLRSGTLIPYTAYPMRILKTEVEVWDSRTPSGLEHNREQTGITITYWVEE